MSSKATSPSELQNDRGESLVYLATSILHVAVPPDHHRSGVQPLQLRVGIRRQIGQRNEFVAVPLPAPRDADAIAAVELRERGPVVRTRAAETVERVQPLERAGAGRLPDRVGGRAHLVTTPPRTLPPEEGLPPASAQP